jgi:hypothetical protein
MCWAMTFQRHYNSLGRFFVYCYGALEASTAASPKNQCKLNTLSLHTSSNSRGWLCDINGLVDLRQMPIANVTKRGTIKQPSKLVAMGNQDANVQNSVV